MNDNCRMSLMIIEIFVILVRIRFSANTLYCWLAICKKMFIVSYFLPFCKCVRSMHTDLANNSEKNCSKMLSLRNCIFRRGCGFSHLHKRKLHGTGACPNNFIRCIVPIIGLQVPFFVEITRTCLSRITLSPILWASVIQYFPQVHAHGHALYTESHVIHHATPLSPTVSYGAPKVIPVEIYAYVFR